MARRRNAHPWDEIRYDEDEVEAALYRWVGHARNVIHRNPLFNDSRSYDTALCVAIASRAFVRPERSYGKDALIISVYTHSQMAEYIAADDTRPVSVAVKRLMSAGLLRIEVEGVPGSHGRVYSLIDADGEPLRHGRTAEVGTENPEVSVSAQGCKKSPDRYKKRADGCRTLKDRNAPICTEMGAGISESFGGNCTEMGTESPEANLQIHYQHHTAAPARPSARKGGAAESANVLPEADGCAEGRTAAKPQTRPSIPRGLEFM